MSDFTKVKTRLYRIDFLSRATTACGWLLYVYEMVHVSRCTPRKEEISFVILVILAGLLIHVSIVVWIGHNKRLAMQGRRGHSTRYTTPVFTHDHLGRQLFFERHFLLSRELVVSIEGNSKFYASADGNATFLAAA